MLISAIEVRNINGGYISENAYRVDRKTPLGNPWKVPPYTQEEAISNYRTYLIDCLKQDTRERIYFEAILAKARKHNITLLCHCWPKPCHADVIKELLEQRLSK